MKFTPDFSQIEKQTLAWHALNRSDIKELLYGGAKGGGKSVFGCYWSYLMAYEIAQKYFPEPPKFPLTVGFIGRKVGRDFRDTTLGTWKRFIPADRYEIKGKPAEIIIEGRVKILTGGLDRSEDIQKFNSAELAFAFIDQAEETLVDDISALRASMRLTINGHELPYKILFTANPRQCWLKQEFILNPAPFRKFIQALPGDNPLLPSSYIENLKDSFKHRPELLQAYLYGDWDSFEGTDQIIKDVWVREAIERTANQPINKIYLVCDTARFGDDETVIMLMNNAEISKQVIMPYCRTTDISGKLAVMSHQNEDCPIVIESTGSDLGAGVVDELMGMGKHVVVYTPQGKPTRPDLYQNVRAEVWSTAAKILCNGRFDDITNCPVCVHKLDDKTRGQLCTPEYKFRGGKILVEPKSDIKSRIGNSPDRADTYVMALWAWKKIPRRSMRETKQRTRGLIKDPMGF